MFRRRSAAPAGRDIPTVAPAAVRTTTAPTPAAGYVRGWAPATSLHPSQQIGAFSGTAVSFRGGATLELQKFAGVESCSAGWIIPPQYVTDNGRPANMQAAAPLGAQRVNAGAAGGLGPITARTMRANVTAAQIRQSGLAAVQWAQTLSPNS